MNSLLKKMVSLLAVVLIIFSTAVLLSGCKRTTSGNGDRTGTTNGDGYETPPDQPSNGDGMETTPPSNGNDMETPPPPNGDGMETTPPANGEGMETTPPADGDTQDEFNLQRGRQEQDI
jgi:hypothetical protein